MAKTLTACQSNYIPWKGYFDLIAIADEFVLYDDVQYSKNGWRNRNRIKTAEGLIWLTVPVITRGRHSQLVRDVVVADRHWARRHWRSIEVHYAHAPHFPEFRDFLEELYLGPETAGLALLSDINRRFLEAMCQLLGIETTLTWMSDFELRDDDRVGRLVELCKKSESTRYVTGPAALEYIDTDAFAREGIEVGFMDYSGYPPYEQEHPPFVHEVSIIDLILSTGHRAAEYLKHAGSGTGPIEPTRGRHA